MQDELVERLRDTNRHRPRDMDDCRIAADRLEAKDAEIARLKGVLGYIVKGWPSSAAALVATDALTKGQAMTDKDGISVEGVRALVDDLVTHAFDDCGGFPPKTHIAMQAADRIEAQAAEIARLREEVERLKSTCPFMLDDCQLTESDLCPVCGMDAERNGGPCVAERAALTKGQVDAG